jgi:hypothetical protein
MKNTLTIVYPEQARPQKRRILAAKMEWKAEEIDFSPIENDIRKLMTMFDNLGSSTSKYEVNEAKLSVGFGKDIEGNIQIGISAKIIPFLFSAEAGGKVESNRSENQLFEIVIKKKT